MNVMFMIQTKKFMIIMYNKKLGGLLLLNDDNNYIGNGSTIVKTIFVMFAGWVLGALAAKGLSLPIDAYQLAEILGAIFGFIVSYIDAKYPNSFGFLGNANLVDMGTILGYPSEEVVLNDEYTYPDDPTSDDDVGDGC